MQTRCNFIDKLDAKLASDWLVRLRGNLIWNPLFSFRFKRAMSFFKLTYRSHAIESDLYTNVSSLYLYVLV